MSEYISREDVINITAETGAWETQNRVRELPTADVQPVDRWISIKDRFPEPEKEVLVWYRYTWGAGFTSYRFGISKWYSNIKRWYEGYLPKDFEVLYWQGLPEPPKEDDVE